MNAVTLVQAWHDALNAGDFGRLAALSRPDIELVGPRGSAFGREVLREWGTRAGLSLTPQAVFARDHVVVVAQRGVWRDADSGEVVGEADVASVFRVEDSLVSFLARHDHLEAALEQAGLTAADRHPHRL